MSAAGRIPVTILGATGMVGQRFVALLDGHARFEVTRLMASPRSAGRAYADVCRWGLPSDIPAWAAEMVVGDATAEPLNPKGLGVAFSGLDSSVARELELRHVADGYRVISNASAFRMDPEVPLVIPEVNGDHLDLLREQSLGEGWIACNPNCSTIGLVLALAPLQRAFGVREVAVTTLQATSGAGYPGVPSLDLIDNVVPFIGGEEEKLVEEPAKILGTLSSSADGPRISPAEIVVSPQCFRVPVVDGHTLSVSVRLSGDPSVADVRDVWSRAADSMPLRYTDAKDRPQPRLDRDFAQGMGITLGRLRSCPLLGLRFVALSHNTVRGAAGGAIATAEEALRRGLLS
ncbi:MAG: aspartate-semialdehyde dehydrogenase [Planctomycetota bacterium]